MNYKTSKIHTHTHNHTTNLSQLNTQTLSLESKEVLPLRMAFGNWLRTLPMEQRFVAVKIRAPGLSKGVRSLFWLRQAASSEQKFQQQKILHDSPSQSATIETIKSQSKLQKFLLQSLVFLSDGNQFLGNLCFDFSLIECPQRLFDILICNVKNQKSCLMDQALKTKRKPENMVRLIQETKVKEKKIEQLINFIRESVLLSFRNSLNDSKRINTLLEQQKQRKKDFNIFWRNATHECRQNILLLQCKDIKELLSYLQKQGINISEQKIDKEIKELLLLQKNQFCNKIFKCKLKKALTPLFDYYQRIYLIWKKNVDKSKRKKYKQRRQRDSKSQRNCEQKPKAHKQKEKKRKSTSVQSNQTNQTENQGIFNSSSPVQKIQNSTSQEKKILIQQKILNQTNTQQNLSKIEVDLNELLSQSTKNKVAKLGEQIIAKASLQKLEQQLQEIADEVSEQANLYHLRRVIAFQRIQFLLAYYSIPIKLFGSCANGIAIKNSDIDIAIDQQILAAMQFIPEGQKVRVALQNLEQLLKNYRTFKQIKVIKTAAIPVMKLTIDTSIPFLSPEYGETYLMLNRSHNAGPINADVTIQTPNQQNQSSHLGIRTTNTISEWLSSIRSLRSIVIVMKSFFTLSRLNLSYQGGLNNFAMIVMFVAFIRHKKLQNQDNSALILRQTLHFYAEEFDQKSFGIDLLCSKQQGIYFKKQKTIIASKTMKADLQIIDPCCQSKNMTRNSYLYPQIKKFFKNILKSCFSRSHSELSSNLQELDDVNKINELIKVKFGQRNVFKDWQKSMNADF